MLSKHLPTVHTLITKHQFKNYFRRPWPPGICRPNEHSSGFSPAQTGITINLVVLNPGKMVAALRNALGMTCLKESRTFRSDGRRLYGQWWWGCQGLLMLKLTDNLACQPRVVLINHILPAIKAHPMGIVTKKTQLDERKTLINDQRSPLSVKNIAIGLIAVEAFQDHSLFPQEDR